MKSMSKFIGIVVLIALIGLPITSCTTTHHIVNITNVPNVSRVYIRNAGTDNWGANIAGRLNNININRYSETVDIRVVDTEGLVFTSYNVPFSEAAFLVTNRERYMGTGSRILTLIAAIPVAFLAYFLYINLPEDSLGASVW